MEPSKFAIFLISAAVLSAFVQLTVASNSPYSRAVVESCRGCKLNRLPEVKAFIFEDVPLYENVEFKHIQGAPPELVLYNEAEEEIERLQLELLTREECKKLLQDKGFRRSIVKDEI